MSYKSIGVKEGADQSIAFDSGAGSITGDVQLGKIFYGSEGVFNNDFANQSNQALIIAALQALAQSAGTKHQGSKAFGSLTGSYQSLLNPGASMKYLMVRNYTDKNVIISFGGASDDFELARGAEKEFNFGSNNFSINEDIQVKLAGAAATAGTVYALAFS